jgi:uncharacterized protein (TIGR02246 family)
MRHAFLWTIMVSLMLCGTASGAALQTPSSLTTIWVDDWRAADLDAVMMLYAPDAVFHPGTSERWSGTAAIRKNFAGILAKFRADPHLTSIQTGISGDLAYDNGTYEETIRPLAPKAKPMRFKGEYLFLFRRDAKGNWRILEQMWTQYGPAKI